MSELNPLNDLSRVYLDKVALMNRQEEQNDVERWQGILDDQMEKSSKELATLGAPQMEEETSYVETYVKELNKTGYPMEEEKKAAKDYDGDGKIESGKDEYFGSKDKAIKKAMGKKVKEEVEEMKEAIGEGDPQDDAIKQYVKFSSKKRPRPVPKAKKESFSDWRNDLSNLIEVAPMTDVEMEKEVKEKKVNNKVVVNPKMSEAVAQIGGELIAEKEVDVPDTRRTVDAIRAYDRSKDASRDATYDTDKGKKKKGDIEKKYAKKERGEIDKDDPNWKKRKYHTGMHGEGIEFAEGYGKKKKHDCASKVKHEEFGVGNCIKGMHTIDENNMVTHYDVEFEEYIVENCPVEELEILVSEMHMHKEMKEGVVSKEVKALQKAGKTLKDDPVVKADKIDTPNYKGQKFGVKEADDWIQKAVKRPGAFTRKAKAAGMSVQQFAKNVDDNPGKYSTRTKKQANLAQTFASMKKEDVEELFYTMLVEEDRLKKFEDWIQFDEGYQRNPEADTRSARQRRMDDPDKGINSPAFRKFMADREKASSAKKVKKSAPAKSKPNPQGTLHLSPEERKKREAKRREDLYKRSADMRRDHKKRGIGVYAKGAKNPGADMDKKLGI